MGYREFADKAVPARMQDGPGKTIDPDDPGAVRREGVPCLGRLVHVPAGERAAFPAPVPQSPSSVTG